MAPASPVRADVTKLKHYELPTHELPTDGARTVREHELLVPGNDNGGLLVLARDELNDLSGVPGWVRQQPLGLVVVAAIHDDAFTDLKRRVGFLFFQSRRGEQGTRYARDGAPPELRDPSSNADRRPGRQRSPAPGPPVAGARDPTEAPTQSCHRLAVDVRAQASLWEPPVDRPHSHGMTSSSPSAEIKTTTSTGRSADQVSTGG